MLKHNGHHAEGSGYADGRLESAPSECSSELLEQIAARCDIPIDKAAEIFEMVEEHIGAVRIAQTSGFREQKSFALMVFRGFRICAAARSPKLQAFAFQCLMLVLGRGEDLGVNTPTELARKLGVTKQNVNHLVCQLRDVLPEGASRLPEDKGQRTLEQRRKFRDERERQETVRIERTKVKAA